MPTPRHVKKPPVNPKLAVAYLRVSTDDQQLGPEAQRAEIDRWAVRHGITIASWHEDRVSGATPLDERPGLGDALAELVATGAKFFVASKRDRIARDPTVSAFIQHAVKKSGGQVVTADGHSLEEDPSTALLNHILDGVAAFERWQIKNRTKAALAIKRRRGEAVGDIPYGKRVEYHPSATTVRGAPKQMLVEHVDEQRVISCARHLFEETGSYGQVATLLAERGILSRSGKKFERTQIKRMLASSDLKGGLGPQNVEGV